MPKLVTPITAVLWSAVLVFAFSCSSDRSFLKQRYTDFKHPKSNRYTHQEVKQPSNKSCLISDENGQDPHVVATSTEEISPDSLAFASHKSHDTAHNIRDRVNIAEDKKQYYSDPVNSPSNDEDGKSDNGNFFAVIGLILLGLSLGLLPLGAFHASIVFAFLGIFLLVVYKLRFSNSKLRQTEAKNDNSGNNPSDIAQSPQQTHKTVVKSDAFKPFVVSVIMFWIGNGITILGISLASTFALAMGIILLIVAAILGSVAAATTHKNTIKLNSNSSVKPNPKYVRFRAVMLWIGAIFLSLIYLLLNAILLLNQA